MSEHESFPHEPRGVPRSLLILAGVSVLVILSTGLIVGLGMVEQVIQATGTPRPALEIVAQANATPSDTPTETPTEGPTFTPSASATVTDVPTAALFPTETATPTYTPTSTDTPTVTPTFTPSLTPTATETPTITPTSTRAPRQAAAAVAGSGARCTAVVGDSVAHGDAVFEVPGTGFATVRMAPVGAYLAYQFQARGDTGMQVINRTAPAVGISAAQHPSYFNTPEYAQLLQDRCAYVVIVPWINDLTGGDPASHAAALGQLAAALANSNPGGKIFVVNYYQGAPAPFATNFAGGFTADRVAAFNGQIAAACSGGGLAIPQVVCISADAAFIGMGTGHLVGPMAQAQLQERLYAPPSPEVGGMLNAFWSSNPGGQVIGDGVHLSSAGKAALAAYLIARMQ